MRVLSLSISVLVLASCSVQVNDAAGPDGGVGPSGGKAGAAGTSVGGAAGTGQSGTGGSTGCEPERTGPTCGDVTAFGLCVCGNRLQLCLAPENGGDPTLTTNVCPPNTTCTTDAGGSGYCKPTLGCSPGAATCAANGDVLTCRADASGFDAAPCSAGSACSATPNGQIACKELPAAAGGISHVLSGHVFAEYHSMTKTGVDPATKVAPAFFNFVAVYNGSKYVGSAITDADGGFQATLTEPPTASTTVYVYVLDFDPKTAAPMIAVARNDDPSLMSKSGKAYWFWSNHDGCNAPAAVTVDASGGGKHTLEPLTILETCGAGAIRLFQWARYAFYRLGDAQAGLSSTRAKHQPSLVIYWEPGSFADRCSAGNPAGCFFPKPYAPWHVTLPGGAPADDYDTAIEASGAQDSPEQWSYSMISHEVGHWVMDSYGKTPNEAAKHSPVTKTKAGMAYSEGWATAFGQWNVSVPSTGDYDGTYLDHQQGTTFWFDIAAGNSFDVTPFPMPDPSGPIDQDISEGVVGGAFWRLWMPQAAGTGTYAGLGDESIFQAFQHPRMFDLNRGYTTADLVDFFDATTCAKVATDAQVSAVAAFESFPWDHQPQCSKASIHPSAEQPSSGFAERGIAPPVRLEIVGAGRDPETGVSELAVHLVALGGPSEATIEVTTPDGATLVHGQVRERVVLGTRDRVGRVLRVHSAEPLRASSPLRVVVSGSTAGGAAGFRAERRFPAPPVTPFVYDPTPPPGGRPSPGLEALSRPNGGR